jgi:hypothetical protein
MILAFSALSALPGFMLAPGVSPLPLSPSIDSLSKRSECYVMTIKVRLVSAFICAVSLNCLLSCAACAGFWGSDDKGKSGLDFNQGYDINTVSTISGRVVAPPHQGEQGNSILEIKRGSETLNVSVGPQSYWEKKGIAINLNDEVSVKGSRAQGQDGKSYLLAQKLANRTSGAQLELRNEKGEPAWSGSSMKGSRSEAGGMMRNQGGGMMRGGGGMMRR